MDLKCFLKKYCLIVFWLLIALLSTIMLVGLIFALVSIYL